MEGLFATIALAAAALATAGTLAHFLRFPPALGYLIAGLVLAPDVIGQKLVPLHELEVMAEVGVLVLLFLIGLELDLKRLRETLQSSARILPFDLLAPILLVTLAASWMGWGFRESIALGIVLALSSTLLGERLTADKPREVRHRVIGVLVAEDVAAGLLLTLLAVIGTGSADLGGALFDTSKLLFLLVLFATGALLLVPRILDEISRTHVPELLVIWTAAIIALSGYLGYLAGSAELGAFLAGVAAAEAGSRFVARNAIKGIRDIAIAIFFFSSGLHTNFLTIPWIPALMIAATFFIAKTVVHAPGAYLSGLAPKPALQTAFGLALVGEFSLLLAAVAIENGIAHPDLKGIVVGCMILLLPLSVLLTYGAPRMERALHRLPDPIKIRLKTLRPRKREKKSTNWPARATRKLGANLILLIAWLLLATYLRNRIALPVSPLQESILEWTATAIIAAPILWNAYKAYQELVLRLFGLRPGEQLGAGMVRIRVANAVAAALVLAAAAIWAVQNPIAWPIVIAAGVLTAASLQMAWSRLRSFHEALENTVGRILGHATPDPQFLNQVLEAYPWGMRSATITVLRESRCTNQTLAQTRLAELSGCVVASIQRRGAEIVQPPPQTKLLAGDQLVLIGDEGQIARAEALLVSHGEAIRLTAQSHATQFKEWTLPKEHPFISQAYGTLPEETKVPLIGIWPEHFAHVRRFDEERIMHAGDRILFLGTPLQIERALAALEKQ